MTVPTEIRHNGPMSRLWIAVALFVTLILLAMI